MALELHGHSALDMPKKTYHLELQDGAGADRAAVLLGLPAESDFVLFGPYPDKSYVRNALALAIGRELGGYQPRTRFAELFLDDQYVGLYVVEEKIKRDKNRVAIPAPASDATAGDVSGGYIFERNGSGSGGGKDWTSALGTVYTLAYPRAAEITPAQRTYLQAHVDRFEAAMKAASWADPTTGYGAFIDVPSWADFALIQELANNPDGYRRSNYFYKAPASTGGLLHEGPWWDFDIAFGNADYNDAARADVFTYTLNRFLKPPITVPFYWEKLWTDRAFQRAVRCRWQALRRGPLSLDWMYGKIDAWVKHVAAAEARDHRRWKTIGVKLWPNPLPIPGSYAGEISYLKDWLAKRVAWLDANLPGACDAP
jgi:hypothetical protein